MRKDYIPVPLGGRGSEITFIEQRWTDTWRRRRLSALRMRLVPFRPEYRVMVPYLRQLPPNARMLDGGCGLGEWTVNLSRAGYRVLGLDISEETVTRLHRAFPGVEFERGDIRDTGQPDDSFDAYFSWGTFEHFEEGMQSCIIEALRILRPGGYLFISVPFENLRVQQSSGLPSTGQESREKRGRRFYQWRLTKAELHGELMQSGFQVLEIRPIHKRQGAVRVLNQKLGLPWHWLFTRFLGMFLAPFLSADFLAHMLIAVARKPSTLSRAN